MTIVVIKKLWRPELISSAELKRRLKRAARYVLSGRESRFYEDEKIGLSLVDFIPKLDENVCQKRINIVTPTLSSKLAFGGVATLVDLPLQIIKSRLIKDGWRIRFLSTSELPPDDENIALKYVARHGIDRSLVEMKYVGSDDLLVPVTAADVFLGSLWFHFFSVLPLLKFQVEVLGTKPIPYVSLVQDYEAAFNPWSSAYMIAQSMYDWDWPMVHFFNSTELKDFYIAQGHPVCNSACFEPTMNAFMLSNLLEKPLHSKTRKITFYGRPSIRRNCFFLAKAALDEWSVRYKQSKDWKVVSVGEAYPSFTLKGGVQVEVRGKLSFDAYCNELRETAVGLSLMASPHPSYPPLEMAHFGVVTVTNTFNGKRLSQWHENIFSLDRCHPVTLADALIEACETFEVNPLIGLAGKTLKPDYLSDYNDEFLRSCAGLVEECLI
jgi:O-antigen biosynthesis protein